MPPSETVPPLDTAAFQPFADGLDYSMLAVTAAHEGQHGGCLVGFTTQASIDPPRMLVCLSVRNQTYAVALHSGHLAVHALGREQGELARLLGEETGDEVDKLAGCRWQEGPGGVPLLEDCPRRFVGRVLQRTELGDHVGFLLEPVAVDAHGEWGAGLMFHDVRDLSAGHDA